MLAAFGLDIVGLGIIIYSPSSAAHIANGEDYLSSSYWEPDDVARHVRAGTIVGVATGTPGTFRIRVHLERPTRKEQAAEFVVRVGLTSDGLVVFRDLYDLLEWDAAFDPAHAVHVAPGHYCVTITSTTPPSGVLGDGQMIDVFVEPVAGLPNISWPGAPQLCE